MQNLARYLLKDFMYQQDESTRYIFKNNKFVLVNRDEFEYHNEFTTYVIVMMILELINCTIDIHETPPLFRQFLYDLHYRKLSRSALEFFLNHHIIPKRKA